MKLGRHDELETTAVQLQTHEAVHVPKNVSLR